MHYDVFISYSRKDSKAAKAIYDALSNAGLSYFIDLEGISGGANFPDVLAKSIDASSVFLLLAGKNSYASKFTMSEVLYAFNHKRIGCIIPWLLDDEPMPADIEFLLGNVNWLDCRKNTLDELVEAIQQAIANPSMGIGKWKKDSHWQKWLFLLAIPFILGGIGIYSQRQKKRAENAFIADVSTYQGRIARADSLIRHSASLNDLPNTVETTPEQIASLKEADACLDVSDSIAACYRGTPDSYRFSESTTGRHRTIKTRLDSMYAVWLNQARDAYGFWQDSPAEAEYALMCAEYALSIKESSEMREMKNKLDKI